MKKIIFLVAVVLGLGAAHAQNTVFNNPSNRAYFGLRAGGDIMFPGKLTLETGLGDVKYDAFKTGGGAELGVIYNLPLVANLYLEPGLNFFYDTYSFKKSALENLYPELDDISSYSTRRFGFRVPVQLGYHFDFAGSTKLHVFTGPELEVGLWSRGYEKYDDEHWSDNLYGDPAVYNRVNLLWKAGVGLTVQNVYVGVSGSFGMLNMMHDEDIDLPVDNPKLKLHENRMTITLGYNF